MNGYDHPLSSHKFAAEVDAAFPGIGKSVTHRKGQESVRVRQGLQRRPEEDRLVTDGDGLFADPSHTGLFTTCGSAR